MVIIICRKAPLHFNSCHSHHTAHVSFLLLLCIMLHLKNRDLGKAGSFVLFSIKPRVLNSFKNQRAIWHHSTFLTSKVAYYAVTIFSFAIRSMYHSLLGVISSIQIDPSFIFLSPWGSRRQRHNKHLSVKLDIETGNWHWESIECPLKLN